MATKVIITLRDVNVDKETPCVRVFTAEWMRWSVDLIHDAGDRWGTTVSRTDVKPSRLVDARDGFETRDAAVSWACDTLRADGAVIFVLGAPQPMTLERLLHFEAVT